MSVKYKIENSKKNKNLIGDEVSVSKIKKPHGNGPKQPTNRMTLAKLAKIVLKIDKKLNRVIKYNNLKP